MPEVQDQYFMYPRMKSAIRRLLSFIIILPLFGFIVSHRHGTLFAEDTKPSSVNRAPEENLAIGSRLELFVDNYLIDYLADGAELRLHHPAPQEIVLRHDAPWEGTNCGFYSVFRDGDIYRMYYKASHNSVTPFESKRPGHDGFTCYAESSDGIYWRKPSLGIHEFDGSKNNNIILAPGRIADANNVVELDRRAVTHPAIFRDGNPNAKPDELYKAILRLDGLFPLKSADGIHWAPMANEPVITDGAFDSQNVVFWDGVRNEYRAYWRYFTEGTTPMPHSPQTWKPGGHRAIRTAVSKDLLHWTEQADLRYIESPSEQLYTNVIKPYYRAPHIMLGFPTRYVERGWSASMHALPEQEHRELRAKASAGVGYGAKGRYGTALTEALFMASRDGVLFKRWNEAFLRPGIERAGTWNYGQQFIGWSVVATASTVEGAPDELSFYVTEGKWTEPGSVCRRYTLRVDGFLSVNAPMSGGEIVTKPLVFEGTELILNFATSAAGDIYVEIQDEGGRPMPGFAVEDCDPLFGDTLERKVTWRRESDLSSLEGMAVRLRFVLRDADLYSLRFR